MAKTNSEIGQAVRDAVTEIQLAANEQISQVRCIFVVDVKNTDTNVVYTKGSKGKNIIKYNQADEVIEDAW